MNYYHLLHGVIISTLLASFPTYTMDKSTLGESTLDLGASILNYGEFDKKGHQPFFPDPLAQSIRSHNRDNDENEKPNTIFNFRMAINDLLNEVTSNRVKTSAPIESHNYEKSIQLLNEIKEDQQLNRSLSSIPVIEDFIDKKLDLTQHNIEMVKNTLLKTYFDYFPDKACAQLQLTLPTIQNPYNRADFLTCLNRADFLTCLDYKQSPFKTLKARIFQEINQPDIKKEVDLSSLLDKICQPEEDTFVRATYDVRNNLPLLYSENEKTIKETIISDINTMIEFIIYDKFSSTTRPTKLKQIIEEITTKKTAYTQEEIKNWIVTIQAIQEETQNHSMANSQIGVEENEKRIREEDREKDLSTQEKLEDVKNNWRSTPEGQIIYLNARNWDSKTKTYILQLLWLNALKTQHMPTMALFRKELERLGQKTPSFMHNKNGEHAIPLLISATIEIPNDADKELKDFIKKQQENFATIVKHNYAIVKHNYIQQKTLLTIKNKKKQVVTLDELKNYKNVLEKYYYYLLILNNDTSEKRKIEKLIENTENKIARREHRSNLIDTVQRIRKEGATIQDLVDYKTNLEKYKNTLTNDKEIKAVDETITNIDNRIRYLTEKNNILPKITNEDIENVKTLIKDNGFQWLLKSERYQDFPDKTSIICLSQLIDLLKDVDDKIYWADITQLSAIYTKAKDYLSLDDKINSKKEIIEVCNKINNSIIDIILEKIETSISLESLSPEKKIMLLDQINDLLQANDLLSVKKYTLNKEQIIRLGVSKIRLLEDLNPTIQMDSAPATLIAEQTSMTKIPSSRSPQKPTEERIPATEEFKEQKSKNPIVIPQSPVQPQPIIQPTVNQQPTLPQPEQPTWTWWNPISWITATTSWVANGINNLFNWLIGK